MSHAQPRAESRRGRDRKGGVLGFLRDLVIILLIAILVSWVLKTFLVRSFYIPSSSMEATLQINDHIIVNQLVPQVIPVDYGDIVVFQDPGGWLFPTVKPAKDWFAGSVEWVLAMVGLAAPDSEDHLVKRVIGLPGDTVVCCSTSGQLEVNGVPLNESYILVPEGQLAAARSEFAVTVPADSLWVMGDNRFNSQDSLAHIDEPSGGFVPLSRVVGKALVISQPISRWRFIDNHPATFVGVEEARAGVEARAGHAAPVDPAALAGDDD